MGHWVAGKKGVAFFNAKGYTVHRGPGEPVPEADSVGKRNLKVIGGDLEYVIDQKKEAPPNQAPAVKVKTGTRRRSSSKKKGRQ